jgi:hypothetical protein
MKLFSGFSNWLFSASETRQSKQEIILWWERRRIAFNVIIGVAGIFSLILIYMSQHFTPSLPNDEGGIESLSLVAAPIFFNMLYTLGWMADAFLPSLPSENENDPRTFKKMLGICLMLVMFPGIFWGLFCLGKLLKLTN